MDVRANIGRQVTVEGVAQNARLGAVVVTSDSTPIYIDGMNEWDSQTLGTSLRVTGTLRRKLLAPLATVNARGEVGHGVEDESYVLEDPSVFRRTR